MGKVVFLLFSILFSFALSASMESVGDSDLSPVDEDFISSGEDEPSTASDEDISGDFGSVEKSDTDFFDRSHEETTIPSKGATIVREIMVEEKIEPMERKVTSVVEGRVVERGTRKPLADITFYVRELKLPVMTDGKGYFKVDLEPGKYTFLIPVVGYDKFENTISVGKSEKLSVTLRVNPKVINPYSITVRAKKKKGEVSVQRISIEEATTVPGTNRDILKVITNMPGVNSLSVFNGYGSGLVIRGSAPEDSLYRVNDQGIPIFYHFGGIESVIEPEIIESIDYYAGGFSPEFGNAMGGVIKANIRDPRKDRFGGYVNLSLLSSSFMLEGPITKKDSLSVSFKRGFLDLYVKLLTENTDLGKEVSFSTYPTYYDGSAVYTHEFSKNNKIKLIGVGAFDDVEVYGEDEAETQKFSNNIESTTWFAELIGEWHFRKKGFKSVFSPMYRTIFFNIDMGKTAFFEVMQHQIRVNEKATAKIGKHHTIEAGARFSTGYFKIDANLFAPPKEGEVGYNPFKEEIEDRKNEWFHYPTFYLMDTMEYGDFIITPGFNSLFDSHNRHWTFDPRLSVRYKLSPQWSLKAATGLYSQLPSVDESYEPWGTEGLEPEHSIHAIGGVEVKVTENIDVDVQGYYKHFYNMIVRNDPDTGTSYSNEGKGYAWGAEVLLRHKMTDNFFGWISYSFSKSRRKDALGPSGGEAEWRPFDMDIPHNITAVASYKLNRYWQFGARFNYSSGVPYTDLLHVNTLSDIDNDFVTPVYDGPVNPDRMPARHQLDIRIDKYWIFDKWILSSYLDVQNAYFRKNVFAVAYNKDYTDKTEVTMLPIMIFFGFKGDF